MQSQRIRLTNLSDDVDNLIRAFARVKNELRRIPGDTTGRSALVVLNQSVIAPIDQKLLELEDWVETARFKATLPEEASRG